MATVIYVPGQCAPDAGLGSDEWAFRYDDGGIYSVGYFPKQIPHPSKRIGLVSRPESVPAFRIPLAEPTGQPGRDFLALIGCVTIIAIAVGLLVIAWRAVFSAG
jgi:hypothetical protein